MALDHKLTQAERAAGNMGRGRPHALADPEYAKLVAALFVAGCSRREMAAELDVNEWTITQWRKDPRIKAHALKLIEERVIQITRRVDATIEARLQHADKLTIKELIEIRKEFLAGTLRQQHEKLDEGTITEAMSLIEQNPDIVEQMIALMNASKKPEGGLSTEPQDGISDELLADKE
jgi:hypothetical protein